MKNLFKTFFIFIFCYAKLLAQTPTTITGTGTIVIPANNQALIEVWGGGGGGGSGIDLACNVMGVVPVLNNNRSAGGGGGGGGFSTLVIPNTTGSPLTLNYTVSFTTGGAGGNNTTPNGATGRTYTFSANEGAFVVTAPGGAGGTAGLMADTDICNGTCVGTGGAGGIGTAGTGTAGGNANINATMTSATNVSTTVGSSGAGGAGANGGGAGAISTNNGFGGTTGLVKGGGGSGGASSQTCGTSTPVNSNRAGGAGGAGLVQYTLSASNIMPIILNSFKATKKGNSSLIAWTTASEINNDKFIIERSANGKEFYLINEQKGAGDNSVLRSYSYTDNSPLLGLNYYRLKQVDFDGKFSYSKITNVMHEYQKMSLKYNSAQGNIKIGSDLSNYNLSIMNSMGQEVKIVSGLRYSSEVSIQELGTGVYYVFVKDKSNTILSKAKIIK